MNGGQQQENPSGLSIDQPLLGRLRLLQRTRRGQDDEGGYASLAQRLQASENTIKSWVHRLRARYRELLRDTVAETVADPAEVQDELRFFVRVLSGDRQ